MPPPVGRSPQVALSATALRCGLGVADEATTADGVPVAAHDDFRHLLVAALDEATTADGVMVAAPEEVDGSPECFSPMIFSEDESEFKGQSLSDLEVLLKTSMEGHAKVLHKGDCVEAKRLEGRTRSITEALREIHQRQFWAAQTRSYQEVPHTVPAGSSAEPPTFPAWYRNEVFEVVNACVGRRSYHQDETMSEALQHLMLCDVLTCVEASLRDEETPRLQQQDGFNMAYFSTELKRAVKDAVIQLQRMQAQVEADADGPLQARRRPDEVADTAWAALVEPIDDEEEEF